MRFTVFSLGSFFLLATAYVTVAAEDLPRGRSRRGLSVKSAKSGKCKNGPIFEETVAVAGPFLGCADDCNGDLRLVPSENTCTDDEVSIKWGDALPPTPPVPTVVTTVQSPTFRCDAGSAGGNACKLLALDGNPRTTANDIRVVCPAGHVATGGGFVRTSGNSEIALAKNGPTGNGMGWIFRAQRISGSGGNNDNYEGNMYVVCIPGTIPAP
eukprot:scaffold80764_cov63-Attheya_sp.AAC.1